MKVWFRQLKRSVWRFISAVEEEYMKVCFSS